jgi:diguanylate cyclase (GGDEF)-like protein/PAS domain S-box-containing protein
MSIGIEAKWLSSDKQTALQRQALELSSPLIVGAALANAIGAGLCAALLWEVAGSGIRYWLAAMMALQVLFFLSAIRVQRFSEIPLQWSKVFSGGIALNSLLWGGGAALLMIPPVSAPNLTAIIVSLGAVVTAGVVFHRYFPKVGAVAIATSLLPACAGVLIQGAPGSVVTACLLAVYGAVLIFAQYALARTSFALLEREFDYAALSREKETYQTHLEQAREIADLSDWSLDLKSGELHWSEQGFEMFGMEPQPLSEQSILEALYWEDRSPYVEALDEALRENIRLSREFRVVHPDGSLRVLRDVAETVVDEAGRPVRMLGLMHDVTGRVTAEKRTKSAYRELNRMVSQMQDTYYRADPGGRLSHVSRSMEKLLGYRPGECVGMRIADLYAVRGHGRSFLVDLHAHGGSLRNYEIRMQHKDGHRVWVSVNAQFIRNEKNQTTGIEGTIRDISDLKSAQMALHQEKELALVSLRSIADGVVTTNQFGKVQYLNPSAERLLGYTLEAAAGRTHQEILRLTDENSGEPLRDLVRLSLALNDGSGHMDEGVLVREDGARYHLRVTAGPMRDHYGHVVGAVLVLHDVTEVMGMAQQLSYQATHDRLTGLKNRPAFEKEVEAAIHSARAGGGRHALFYLDLDQFKVVNDTCGHHAGDELLQQVATLMRDKVRDSDVISRLGGDEFGVLLRECPREEAVDIAEAILRAVRDFRFAWGDKVFEVGISIGVVPITLDSGNLAQVLAAADAACYVAKDTGRSRLHVYESNDDAVMQRHGEMQWVHRISSAFEEDRFVLYGQPIAHVAGDRVVTHYEILIRMKDEDGRTIPPGAFIPAAERYDLMPLLDRWVIRTTLQMLHQAQGDLAFPPVECAINLSGRSLCDHEFLEYVIELFEESGVPCEAICFEVTETAAVANLSRATHFINVLRGMGCSFALDDFGSGLSSFGYLKNMPIDYLKIDGGFVRDMVHDRVDRAMVESINQIGHIMGLKTIGEYAEDEEVLLALERAGVDFAQGYGIARPAPFDEILEAEARQPDSGISAVV